MTAEEFYNKGVHWLWRKENKNLKQDMIDFAEAYHQSRVNAISDEYRKDINKNHAMTDEVKHQRTQASLYIQNKLLKKG